MIRQLLGLLALAVFGAGLNDFGASASVASVVSAATDTVHVAAPTGEKDIDRASIFAALDEVEPGGTIQFAPGTYLIGEIIHVTVPWISVLGHPDGTTLRGCHPDMFPRQAGWEEMFDGRSGLIYLLRSPVPADERDLAPGDRPERSDRGVTDRSACT